MQEQKFDEKQLAAIEKLAGLFYSYNQVAVIVGINEEMLKDESSLAYKSFHKGRLLSDSELRESIITTAKQGSSPAQQLAYKMVTESEYKNMQ